ncbi:uncharacterized protein LOC123516451 isoform X2 [Portunus trituberculatus]|uniref:uncharacterized protein LOC123516451 isoform X2 n=1 Tax=Portunus trituberculatus TaxID=210409 RepID=UPI001E1D12C4|nr:uncharacterized protein LOC123516451 isoform X2 [Portunus trituberculatus]
MGSLLSSGPADHVLSSLSTQVSSWVEWYDERPGSTARGWICVPSALVTATTTRNFSSLILPAVVGNNCGCWGTNEVYVQYKPPVSGWFHHKRGFLFERRYTVDTATAETQMHHFQLRYMKRKGNWLLLEKKRGWNVLSKSNQNSTEQFIVSCPTGQCSCQTVKVEGSSCWSINGQYNKSYKNRKLPGNLNRTRPYDSNKRRSQCLLAELQQCLNNNKGRKIDDGCKQYIRPLMNSTKLMHKYEHYTYRKYYYNLIKADDHDFWLIESENKVYAVSRNTGPCPDQLMPDSKTWLRTDNFTENITVTCTTWDNPSVVGNTCGCWGTNQIYVHYKPPVSGWFHLSHRHNFLFERIYTVYAAEPQMHHFQLRYMVTKRNWLLLEKKYGKLVLIINTRRQYNKADEKFIISCPSGQCSCQKLQVRGSSCSRINGIFHRCERSNLINFILNGTVSANHSSVHVKPREYKRRHSLCLLRQLAECLYMRNLGLKPGIKSSYHCGNHIKPMIKKTDTYTSYPEQYIYYNYKLLKANDQDFWMIGKQKIVYLSNCIYLVVTYRKESYAHALLSAYLFKSNISLNLLIVLA